jgi:hypothetical protein
LLMSLSDNGDAVDHGCGAPMTVNRDQLFAELDGLSADEIEAGLDAGVWSGDRRQLVEHYLDQMKLTTMQIEAAEAAKVAAQAAEGQSRRATSMATVALVLAAGAMLAAMAAALIAFLALRRYGFQPPW